MREAERARHSGRDKLSTRQRAELGDEYAIGKFGQQVLADLQGQSRLADAAAADQADQPMFDDQSGDLSQLGLSIDQFRNRLRKVRGPRRRRASGRGRRCGVLARRRAARHPALSDGCDEPVPSPGQRLDEQGLPGVIPQNRSNGRDVALQNLRLNVRFRPQRLEELIVGHQSSGVLDEIPQHIKSLGG